MYSPLHNPGYPSTPTILFHASPPQSARHSAFDTELAPIDSPRPTSDGSLYDPHAPLLPNRLSRPHAPQQLQLSGARYEDFDARRLYSPKRIDPFSPSPAASETEFLKTPSSALFPGPAGRPKPPRLHPFARSFEAPEWMYILIHLGLCSLAYPVLLLTTIIASNKSIFWSRLIVGIGCGAVGVALGLSLARLAQRFLEAATWATLIHQSRAAQNPGIRLRDFADSSASPTSILAGLKLLWSRTFYQGASRRARAHYDPRPWTFYVLAFLIMVTISSSLPFILGRVVDIRASIVHQSDNYYEVAVAADLSEDDLSRAAALDGTFNDFRYTWTLSPFSSHGNLPSPVMLQWEEDTVYFAETTLSQLLPGGTGFGTFDSDTTAATTQLDIKQATENSGNRDVSAGMVLRYPRWGIRIRCTKSTDPNTILPRAASGLTYMFVPHEILRNLFDSFGREYPAALGAPLNLTRAMQPNDTFPATLNADDIAMSAVFYDNGVAHSFFSSPVSMGDDGAGFVSIESLLVRLNTTYTPQGTFLTHPEQGMPDVNGTQTFVGMDSAVCLELYEPYVLETYNSTTGIPATTRIVSKTNTIVDANGKEERNLRRPLTGENLKRELNSSSLRPAYNVAHGNSANQILKDNGRDAYYVPSPTLVSFTGGTGPQGYLELSADFFSQARGFADASNVLTYLAGSGQTVARCYPDNVTTFVKIATFDAVVVLGIVTVLGVFAGLFVPRLPFSIPRRGFELYSWLAAFYSNELVLEKAEQRGSEDFPKHLELEDIKRHMGDLRFHYGV
ncbi:hypothetical protein MKEN_00050400 [Mycena kentingensis (nom. inval.)]|nr:hypothetical protein MKEN_00050400 [Mycena kentingensis (nom. inval.)]